ncbi:uncharacterized protein LOC128951544 [Oppia nitens]|uniref:uncharacterized protein LOC128951544 n=1 Tax=Oppia nitens TaxID=1686743 RepID=UPI0023DBB2C8|nr:uncharacterized protein LOC128951544 [Oppia nitens]
MSGFGRRPNYHLIRPSTVITSSDTMRPSLTTTSSIGGGGDRSDQHSWRTTAGREPFRPKAGLVTAGADTDDNRMSVIKGLDTSRDRDELTAVRRLVRQWSDPKLSEYFVQSVTGNIKGRYASCKVNLFVTAASPAANRLLLQAADKYINNSNGGGTAIKWEAYKSRQRQQPPPVPAGHRTGHHGTGHHHQQQQQLFRGNDDGSHTAGNCKSVIKGLDTRGVRNLTDYVRQLVDIWNDGTVSGRLISKVETNTRGHGPDVLDGKVNLFVTAVSSEASRALVVAAKRNGIQWIKYMSSGGGGGRHTRSNSDSRSVITNDDDNDDFSDNNDVDDSDDDSSSLSSSLANQYHPGARQRPTPPQSLFNQQNQQKIKSNFDRNRVAKQLGNKSLSEFVYCKLCLDQRPTDECQQFGTAGGGDCRHVFCRECLSQYLDTQITDGLIHHIKCPDDQCTAEAAYELVCKLLSRKSLVRYHKLLLKKTVETMDDIAYCPKCNDSVEIDTNRKYGYCEQCEHPFCTGCRRKYHGSQSACIDNDRALRQRAAEIQESESYINAHFKHCPKCDIPCEKIDGCNHMQCKMCMVHFCWLCLMDITDNDEIQQQHWRAKCKLFEYESD